MDDGTSDTIHHPAQRKSRFLGWGAFIAPPPGCLAQELGPHLGATIVGRAKFVWKIVGLGAEWAGFERNDFQTCLRKDRRDD
jgi:hypothetical protein